MTDKVPPVHRHRTGKRLGELQQLRERFRAPLPSWERGHAQRPAGPQPGMLANLAAAGLTSEWTDRFHRLSLLATATVESLIPLPWATGHAPRRGILSPSHPVWKAEAVNPVERLHA